MPYDPTPNGDAYYPSIQWDASGKPFQMTQSGQKSYIPPASAATSDPKDPVGAKLVQWANSQGATYANPGGATPKGGFASNRGTFDSGSGNFDGGNFFNTSLGGLILGGSMIAAPYAAGALAGGGGEAAPLASSTVAPEAGTLAATSTVPATGALVPATTSSLATTGGSTSILSNLKTAYDWYNKGSQVYDSVKGAAGPSPTQALGQTAGSIEQGRLNALIAQAKLQQEQDQLGLSRANTGVNVGNLDLAQHKQALAAPGQEAGNSVRGDILANSRDATISGLPSYIHVPNISGGLRPSMLSDNSRQLGAKMSRDALTRSMSGADTNFAPLPKVPDATPLPESTGLDSLLQGVAGGSSILGALGSLGSHSTAGGSHPQVQPGGQIYAGPGTPGYPGDGVTDANPMVPPNGPNDQAPADPTPTGAGDGEIDPSILEWLRRNGQAS